MEKPEDDVAGDGDLRAILDAIASRDVPEVSRLLEVSPGLTRESMRCGAHRRDPEDHFLVAISHYLYAGDTALHVAAAAYHVELAARLLAAGADVGARNRRGAEPLHYAADGGPGVEHWEPQAQRDVIISLIMGGANVHALDRGGVTPLHRAVRARSSAAVTALIEKGADPLQRNNSGSTPLHLAVQSTGRGGAGSVRAKSEQRRIISLLLHHGARSTDTDAKGTTVAAAATSDWIRDLVRSRPGST